MPYLILGASVLLAVQVPLAIVVAAADERQLGSHRSHEVRAALPIGLATIYGGYFGAGLGVILLAVVGLLLDDSLTRLNALKQAISLVTNFAAAIFFVFSGQVVWPAALVMAVGAMIGGALGGRLANRISADASPAAGRRDWLPGGRVLFLEVLRPDANSSGFGVTHLSCVLIVKARVSDEAAPGDILRGGHRPRGRRRVGPVGVPRGLGGGRSSRTVTVERGTMVVSVVATGKVEPITTVELKSKANGIIERLLVDVDQVVEPGQVLAELDKENLNARLREARANLQAAEAAHAGAEAQLKKNEIEAESPEVDLARRNLRARATALRPEDRVPGPTRRVGDGARAGRESASRRRRAARRRRGARRRVGGQRRAGPGDRRARRGRAGQRDDSCPDPRHSAHARRRGRQSRSRQF